MNRAIVCLMVLGVGLCLTGCKTFRLAPKLVPAPSVVVERVELVEVTDAGARLMIYVTLTSTADEPLPLAMAGYTLKAGSDEYVGSTNPNATLPKRSTQTIALPAAVSGAPGSSYTVHGSITYRPPGEIRGLMTDMGVPLPSVGFSGSGEITGQPAYTSVLLAPPPPPAQEAPVTQETPQAAPDEVEVEVEETEEVIVEEVAPAEEQSEAPPATDEPPAESPQPAEQPPEAPAE